MRNAGIALSFVLTVTLAHASTIKVPTDQATIQAGINAASDFDTVLVLPGTYTGAGNQNISFMGKRLAIIGEKGRDSTILDLTGTGMNGFLTEDTLLPIEVTIVGLTIMGATKAIEGQPSTIYLSNLRILKCQTGVSPYEYSEKAFSSTGRVILTNTIFDSTGGAVILFDGVIDSCTFKNGGTALFYPYFPLDSIIVSNSSFDHFQSVANFGESAKSRDNENLPRKRSASFAHSVIFNNCLFEFNESVFQGRFDVAHSIIRNNTKVYTNAYAGKFGAVNSDFLNNDSTLFSYSNGNVVDLSYCRIANNHCNILDAPCGPYCYVDDGIDLDIHNCIISNNGGGITIDRVSWFRMTQSIYSFNKKPIYILDQNGVTKITINNCTLNNNDSGAINLGFSGLAFENDSIKNIIAYQNHLFGIFADTIYDTLNPTITCSDIHENDNNYLGFPDQTGTNGNISADPIFCDAANGDYSLYSHSPCAPANNSCGVQMGAYGVGCAEPLISDLQIDGATANQHVLDHTPLLTWIDNPDTLAKPQTKYEIAVGTDNDWQFAELWNPATFTDSETAREYNGSPLVDGQTGYIRMRMFDGLLWSNWFTSSFRLNTPPTVPILANTPDMIASTSPTLYLHNATDPENDALSYEYQVYSDSDLTTIAATGNSPQTNDSTGWMVSPPLTEDARYWWRARAYDGYEYSGWSQTGSFYTDGTPEPPSVPSLIQPPDSTGKPTFTMLPTFKWHASTDPDPLDTIRYKLQISTSPTFTFVSTYDSLTAIQHTLADSLEFGKHYYWRVTAFDTDGLTAQSTTANFWTWTLGDVNHSHTVTISDLTYLVAFLFNGGAPVSPLFVGDMNHSCTVTISDLTYLVNFLFNGGPAPKVGCAP